MERALHTVVCHICAGNGLLFFDSAVTVDFMVDFIMYKKTFLREIIKRLKSQFTEEELLHKSANVWAEVQAKPMFRQAESVLLYWSMPEEVYTHDLIRRWYGKKTIILPVVDGDKLRLIPFAGEQSLMRNAVMNLYEPQGYDYSSPETIELAIIPGIAFDLNNHRLGRGQGYYDRLLPQLNTYNIGVCFDFQLFEAIPYEEFDVRMDEVVSG